MRLRDIKVRKYRLKDFFTPFKWYSFVYGYLMKWIFPDHYIEQYIIRKTTEECQPCVKAGACVSCGCDVQAKMRVPKEHCTQLHWDHFLSKKEYLAEKEKWGINLVVEYNKKQD